MKREGQAGPRSSHYSDAMLLEKGSDLGRTCGPAENQMMSLKGSALKWQQTVQEDFSNPPVSTAGPSTSKPSTAAATNAALHHHRHSVL